MTEKEKNSIEDKRLRRDPRDEVWENWQGAVLLRREIEYYASLDPPLIEDLDPEHLEPASYHLRLGKEYRLRGQDHSLSDEDPKLVIQPHELAVVSTLERLNIPGFLIGRWNLRVTDVYQGLLWVGGPQVDPGYQGHLYCPLYNLSTRAVELSYKEPLFTIDFVRTTRFGKVDTMWPRTKPDSLGAHDVHRLQSGVFEDLRKVEQTASRMEATQRYLFPVLAIIIAAVTIIAMFGVFGRFEDAECLSWASIGISGVAVVIASLALFFGRNRRK